MGSNANNKNHNCNYPQVARDAGFKLRQYKDGPLDWRLMGSYEVERILREQNFEQVDYALYHLSEAPLGSALETNILDSGIAKYFVMSQFSIQYLMFCRKFLDEMLGDLREAHGAAQLELAQTRKALTESNNEIVQLHKKITQIEAIREVVYPCHLCTKNFISNEALNIHISRKHHLRQERHDAVDSPVISTVAPPKDKETDMTLINTIKMELEIKQLKERLNAAEKNIKERGNGSSRKTTPRSENKEVRSVGIQNNLMEPKEKDDISEAHESENSEQKEQLHELQVRISSFESWQERLKQSNEKFIEEINQKLEGITMTLNNSKQQRSEPIESDAERIPSPALDNLERVLMEKINEISKASTAKLEEVVKHMENGYKQKLEAMERDLKRLIVSKQRVTEEVQPKKVAPKDDDNVNRIKRQVELAVKAKYDENTYSIGEDEGEKKPQQQQQPQKQMFPKAPIPVMPTKSNVKEQPTASSDSNRTYIKTDEELDAPLTKVKTVAAAPKPAPVRIMDAEAETTDVSESLNDERLSSDEASEHLQSEDEKQPMPSKLEKVQLKKPRSPRPVTRKDARKMVNKRLLSHGFDMQSKNMTNAMLKRANSELAEQRSSLKLKYPHFYVTRNRIKKFVDKLCSAKLTERAETMLKYKKPLQPVVVTRKRMESNESMTETEESATSEHANGSTPPDGQQQTDFKDRLNRLLSMPAASTAGGSGVRSMTIAQIHGKSMQDPLKPVPLPRKRVMFNTMGNGKTFDDSDLDQLK